MKITVACVGRIKEKYFSQGIDEYIKRLSRYADVEICQVSDEKAPEDLSDAQKEQIKDIEGKRLLKAIKKSYVIALAIDGKQMDSVGFADLISDCTVRGISHITFVIGGSLGLSKQVLDISDYRLSFSQMTFPHQLMRVILLEQIYRAFRIIKNEPYHK